jgi:proton glutamate symport protein
VFALVLPLAIHSGAALVGSIGLYILVYCAACVVLLLLLYVVVTLSNRTLLRRFAKAALPAQIIAFSSSSSLAALPALFDGADRELELPRPVSGFVLPLAASTFKVATPLAWTLGALFVGWMFGEPLGIAGLATVAVVAIFLSMATPGVPRGAFITLAPVFLAVGLPVEGVGILIAIDAIPDALVTVVNTTGYLTAATIVARDPRNTSSDSLE